MGRVRLFASLVGIGALVALLTPASAIAGTYSWGQPGDFTGANPEMKYGQPSWSYYQGAPGSTTRLSCTPSGCSGGGDSVSVSGGKLVLQAAAGGAVTVGWSNPFTSNQSVTISPTFSVTGLLCGAASVTPSGTTTLAPGASVTVTLSGSLLNSCTATGTISIFASVSAPSTSVTSPTAGATVSTLQQTYAGNASSGFGISDQVTVRVYSGPSASGSPVETLSTTASGGTYSVSSGSVLANGQYTVQAEQDDVVGDRGFSVPITFAIANPPPTVSLDSLGSAPLGLVTPTLTGTGSTRSLDSGQVSVQVYSGTSTSSPPVRTLTASLGAAGRFTVQVQPALPDGEYTAVATQSSSVGLGSSPPVAFRVKATPPALTLEQPSAGVTLNDRRPTFSGRAGDALGDSSAVTVYLYKGSGVTQNPFGTERVSTNGSTWSAHWAHKLGYRHYTVVAVQTDDAGHTSRTTPVTFIVAPTPKLIGATATISHSGGASVPVGCLAGPGQTCTGTVLIVTRHAYRATPGGPTGRLEVLFSNVRIPGGRSLVIHHPVTAAVLRILRRFTRVPVVVTVKLSSPAGHPMRATADRVLTIRR